MATQYIYFLLIDRLGEIPQDAISLLDPRIGNLSDVADDDMLATVSTSHWLIWFLDEMASGYRLNELKYLKKPIKFFQGEEILEHIKLFSQLMTCMEEDPGPAQAFFDYRSGLDIPSVSEYVREFRFGNFRDVDDDNHPGIGLGFALNYIEYARDLFQRALDDGCVVVSVSPCLEYLNRE